MCKLPHPDHFVLVTTEFSHLLTRSETRKVGHLLPQPNGKQGKLQTNVYGFLAISSKDIISGLSCRLFSLGLRGVSMWFE